MRADIELPRPRSALDLNHDRVSPLCGDCLVRHDLSVSRTKGAASVINWLHAYGPAPANEVAQEPRRSPAPAAELLGQRGGTGSAIMGAVGGEHERRRRRRVAAGLALFMLAVTA